MLTKNEKKVLRYLLANVYIETSINQISKECHLSPNGAYKILKRLESEGVLLQKKIANIISYKINFMDSKTKKILALAITDKIEGKVQHRYQDLRAFMQLTSLCAIYGSYLTKTQPHDLDLFFILSPKKYAAYAEKLRSVQDIVPLPIHDLVQTKQDFITNLKKGNKVLESILREGIVLWGQEELIEVLSHV